MEFLREKSEACEKVETLCKKLQNEKGVPIVKIRSDCKVVIYNYVLCWLYSMTKSVIIALILLLVFCGILLYWV